MDGTIGGTLPGSYEGTTYWVGGSPYSSFYYSQSNIYEEGGQSGSPVFAYYNNGQPSVILDGVMDVANSTTGYAERITSSVYNDLESWMANDGTDSGLRKVKTLNPPSEPPAPAPAPTPANSQTILSNSAAAAIYGQPLTFTVTVSGSGSVPTGTVTFLDGGTVLGTAKLNRNPIGVADATFTTSTLGAGSHAITAVYSGDSGFNGSFSETVTETVTETAASPVYPVFTLDSNGSLWQDGDGLDHAVPRGHHPWRQRHRLDGPRRGLRHHSRPPSLGVQCRRLVSAVQRLLPADQRREQLVGGSAALCRADVTSCGNITRPSLAVVMLAGTIRP